jgi:hypothetical protein
VGLKKKPKAEENSSFKGTLSERRERHGRNAKLSKIPIKKPPPRQGL